MGNPTTIPFAGIFLALATFVAMLLLKVDLGIAFAITLVWIGSLVLAASQPPEPAPAIDEQPISIDSIGDLIENSATPLLVTKNNSIAIANRAARKMLGRHVIGQDARMAFRQPEAISLLAANRNGRAIVRGLVRRRDIWQINRQAIDSQTAVIELINQTAEADISRAHTDFVANASHELRTPLAGIIGYTETLSESGEALDSPTAQKFLGTIQSEAQRMRNLVSDLMSLSRVEAEKHDAPTERIDFWPVIERAARDAAGSVRMNRLDFVKLETAAILGDVQQLEQLVRNLVDNALKYGAEDKPVRVELSHTRDGQTRLCVSNQGEGIAQEHIPHLTRRFYRTDPGRSRASGGTGLGLAIVKHIVERHRGRLDIQSELGQGTEVIVRIPMAKDDLDGAPANKDGALETQPDSESANSEAAQKLS